MSNRNSSPNTLSVLFAVGVSSLAFGISVAPMLDKDTAGPKAPEPAELHCEGVQQIVIENNRTFLSTVATRVILTSEGITSGDVEPRLSVAPRIEPEIVAPTDPGSPYQPSNGYSSLRDNITEATRVDQAKNGILEVGEVVYAPISCRRA